MLWGFLPGRSRRKVGWREPLPQLQTPPGAPHLRPSHRFLVLAPLPSLLPSCCPLTWRVVSWDQRKRPGPVLAALGACSGALGGHSHSGRGLTCKTKGLDSMTFRSLPALMFPQEVPRSVLLHPSTPGSPGLPSLGSPASLLPRVWGASTWLHRCQEGAEKSLRLSHSPLYDFYSLWSPVPHVARRDCPVRDLSWSWPDSGSPARRS